MGPLKGVEKIIKENMKPRVTDFAERNKGRNEENDNFLFLGPGGKLLWLMHFKIKTEKKN